MTATPWDGVGPKEECLLCIDGEWTHVEFREGDLDVEEGYWRPCGEILVFRDADHFSKTYNQYTTKGTGYTVTHYAPLPVIPTINSIENDVEEGARVG